MTGVSYDGSTPWSVASRGNPYLKTIIPISGVPDIYGLMYRNGSSESRGPLLLNALYIEGSLASGTPADIPGRLCPEAFEGLALSGVAGIVGSDPTGYWAARNRKPGVEANYKGSVYSVQGLYDWNVDPSQVVPWVDHLESLGIRTKQLLGQWEHSWPDSIGSGTGLDCPNGNPAVKVCNRADWKESVLHWLDHELKGMDVDTGPAMQVADDIGRWRNEAHYPPHDTNWTALYLGASGDLVDTPGAGSDVALLPVLAPLPPGTRPSQVNLGLDFAEYRMAPVDRDLLVVGLPKVPLQVTPLGPGGYIGAFLYDRAPGENPGRLIGFTTMNLAFADGTTTFTPVVPGLPVTAKLEVQPMDSVIVAGHSLVLRIWVFTDAAGSNARVPTLPPSPVLLHVGDANSVFRLPTVERGPEVYFTPPTRDAPVVS
jgi:predicted acyl esterase